MIFDFFSGECDPLVVEKVFKELIFLCGKLDPLSSSEYFAAAYIHGKISRSQKILSKPVGGPGQNTDPGHQFLQGKRLDQIVIGAGIKAAHPVLDRIARCQKQDRGLFSGSAQAGQDFEPVGTGHHDVQNSQIIFCGLQIEDCLAAVQTAVDAVAGIRQFHGQDIVQISLIFCDQDSHWNLPFFISLFQDLVRLHQLRLFYNKIMKK